MADMNAGGVSHEILSFYEGYSELDRLSSGQGRLELLRTQEILRRMLPPPPGRVLDVGGGPGTYARWLAELGYTTHVVDPVAKHVESARGSGVTASLGDARALEAADSTFDAVLVMGPMYHLPEAEDRALVMREARRVAKPGAPVAVSAISWHAPLIDSLVKSRSRVPGSGSCAMTSPSRTRQSFDERSCAQS